MGALGLLLGLSVWILWSKYLPAQLFRFDAVPKTGWDEFRRIWYPRFEAWYQKFIKLPLGLYLIPAVLGCCQIPLRRFLRPCCWSTCCCSTVIASPQSPSRRCGLRGILAFPD